MYHLTHEIFITEIGHYDVQWTNVTGDIVTVFIKYFQTYLYLTLP